MSRSISLSLLVLCLSSYSGNLAAQSQLAGKRVVVVNDKTTLAVSGRPSGIVSEGSVFTVDKVVGEWLWIQSERAYLRPVDIIPFEEAIAHYSRKLETARTANNYWHRSKIWRLTGDLDNAISDMNEAIRLNPTSSALFTSRGTLWDDKKEYDKALADFDEAIRLDPKFEDPRIHRRGIWRKRGEWDKVVADLDVALKEQSPTAASLNGLAWLRATSPDARFRNGSQAVEYATNACELSEWKAAYHLDTLAAAYAEAGEFDKAVEWQKKGTDLAPAEEKADFMSRLTLYQDKKPYRDLPVK